MNNQTGKSIKIILINSPKIESFRTSVNGRMYSKEVINMLQTTNKI